MAFAAGEQGRHAALLQALCHREKQAVGSTALLQTRVSEAAYQPWAAPDCMLALLRASMAWVNRSERSESVVWENLRFPEKVPPSRDVACRVAAHGAGRLRCRASSTRTRRNRTTTPRSAASGPSSRPKSAVGTCSGHLQWASAGHLWATCRRISFQAWPLSGDRQLTSKVLSLLMNRHRYACFGLGGRVLHRSQFAKIQRARACSRLG